MAIDMTVFKEGRRKMQLGRVSQLHKAGKSVSEIAEILNLPESTIRSWIEELIVPTTGRNTN